jgi:hypothetical protein
VQCDRGLIDWRRKNLSTLMVELENIEDINNRLNADLARERAELASALEATAVRVTRCRVWLLVVMSVRLLRRCLKTNSLTCVRN